MMPDDMSASFAASACACVCADPGLNRTISARKMRAMTSTVDI